MNLKDITLPAFLWYILPGVNAIVLLIVVPVTILDFDTAQRMLSWSSVVGYLMGSLVIGFLMDSMKLYQFTFGYDQSKKQFFSNLGNLVGVESLGSDQSDAERCNLGKVIFDLMRLSMEEDDADFPSWEHSRWVMVNHTSKIAFAAALMWALLLGKLHSGQIQVLGRYSLTHFESLLCLVLLSVGFMLVGFRLARESRDLMEDANRIYGEYVSLNRKAILDKMSTMDAASVLHPPKA